MKHWTLRVTVKGKEYAIEMYRIFKIFDYNVGFMKVNHESTRTDTFRTTQQNEDSSAT